jgi:hypothetical protein
MPLLDPSMMRAGAASMFTVAAGPVPAQRSAVRWTTGREMRSANALPIYILVVPGVGTSCGGRAKNPYCKAR